MNTNQIRELIKNLQIIMRCPGCGKRYNLEEIFLKGYAGTTYFLQLDCSNCRTPVYATIAISGNLSKMIKDAEKKTKEVKVKKQDKISTDEIIEMHEFLKNFKEDFQDLFEK